MPGQGGRWNIGTIGCFLWPWSAWPRRAAPLIAIDAQRFVFSPFGIDAPLVNAPAPVGGQPNGPDAVATPLRRRDPYGAGTAAARSIAVYVGGTAVPFALGCLADVAPGPSPMWGGMPGSGVVVDPELGRLAFAVAPAGAVTADFYFGAVGVLGGGPYPRGAPFNAAAQPVFVPVAQPSPAAAIAAASAATLTAVEVAGNGIWSGADVPQSIGVAAGQQLEIRAADGAWPVLQLSAPLTLSGGAGASLILDGFVIEGAGLVVPAMVGGAANGLASLTLRNCTLVPGLSLARDGTPTSPGAASLASTALDTVIAVQNCVIGAIRTDPGSQLRISNSVVDAGSAEAAALGGASTPGGPCGALWMFNSTIRGGTSASLVGLASNTIFGGALTSRQRQSGIVRFSFVPQDATGPRQYSCASPGRRRHMASTAIPFVPAWQRRLCAAGCGGRPRRSCPAPTMAGRWAPGMTRSTRRWRTGWPSAWPSTPASACKAGFSTPAAREGTTTMKGDFTRLGFDRTKRFSRVLMQQGRVQLDRDWNEQQEIDLYVRRTAQFDGVATMATPALRAGFAIGLNTAGTDLTIGPGRLYANGLLCENDAPALFSQQSDAPLATGGLAGMTWPTNLARYLVYLDVWERDVSAVEDPSITEPALNGPDTTTRSRVVLASAAAAS